MTHTAQNTLPAVGFAQTNLALYRELTALGTSDADLARVHKAYHLAVRLFANRFRADGRPFVTHLIGTASVIVALGEHADSAAATDSVLAGLLHAAYAQGEFGDRLERDHPSHRAQLRKVLGESAEALVHEYNQMPWPPKEPKAIADRAVAGALDATGQLVHALRAANEYDDVRDLAPLYYGGSKTAVVDAGCAAAIEIATAMGLTRLAEALSEAVAENRAATVPDAVRSDRDRSFVVENVRLRERLMRLVFKR